MVKNLKRIIAGIFFSLLIIVSICAQDLARNSQNQAILLSIKGGIGPAAQELFHTSLEQAIKNNNRLLIMQLDTPGGLSESMRDIIQEILSSPIPIVVYVAPSGARAASAGTYILYASHVAAMAPGTNLGAATPISLGMPGTSESPEKDKTKNKSASELKAINDARAYIRSLAQLRGRNVQWAESAVTQAHSLSAEEALKMKVIDVVAKNIPDLLQQINGKKVLVQGNPVQLNTQNIVTQEIKPNWRTRFLMIITDPSVAYILLLIGFYGLFFEFLNPGFVLPGVIGAISLLIALYALHLLPLNYAGLALIILGLAFLVAEVFFPSGILAFGGIVGFVLGSIFLLKPGSGFVGIPWQLITSLAVVTLIFVIGIVQFAIRSRRKKIVSGAEAMVGAEGIVIKANGEIWVQIEGELWRAESTQTLREGQKIYVKAVKGLILEVEPRQN